MHDTARKICSPRARWRRVAVAMAMWLLAITVAGCGASTPAATGQGSTARSPVARDTEMPTSTPVPSRTPDADQVAAKTALEAFGVLIERKDLSYHETQEAFVSVDGQPTGDLQYETDVSGNRFAGTLTSGGQTVDLVHVDGTLYTRLGTGAWSHAAIDPVTVADIVDPWQYLGPIDEFVFLTKDPETLKNYQFVIDRSIPYQTSAMRAQGIAGTIQVLRVILAPDGRPVRVTIGAAAQPTSGQLAGKQVHITTFFDFTAFGEPVSIEVPE